MMAGTSPSIAPLASGNFEVAFQANTGNLWTVGGDPHGDWGLGMMVGTSPGVGSTGASGGSPGSSLAPPASSSAPTILGTAQQGKTLTLVHAAWRNSPTSYAEQWLDCDSAGNSCAVIAGATSPTYTLAASDVGHTIRVKESATNAAGTGGPLTASATAAVTSSGGGRASTGGGGAGGSGGTRGSGGAGGSGGSGGAACVVPRLRHMTVGQARRALQRAHCRLGKIRRPRHVPPHHALHVTSQTPQAHTRHPNGYKVNVGVS
jgi:hypothetical protein